MLLSLNFPQSPRPEISVLLAAHSAFSTFIVQNENVRDLSRLGLIRCSAKWQEFEVSTPLTAKVALKANSQDPAGTRYFFEILLSTLKNRDFASVEFEILERKRGVKSSVLRELSSTEIETAKTERSWTFDDFCSRFPDFSVNTSSGLWSLEALVLLLLAEKDQENVRFCFEYRALGVAHLNEGVSILRTGSETPTPSPLQIIQGSQLIGQLI